MRITTTHSFIRSIVAAFLLAAQSSAQTTFTVENFRYVNFQNTNSTYGGTYFETTNAGYITIDPDSGFVPPINNVYSGPLDIKLRLAGLNLDSIGGNNDYINFTLRVTPYQSGANVVVSNQGIGLKNSSVSVNDNLDPGEKLTLQIINPVVGSTGTAPGGSASFSGFTAAAFGGGGGGQTTNRSYGYSTADINGQFVDLNLATTDADGDGVFDYQYKSDEVALPSANSVVFDSVTATQIGSVIPGGSSAGRIANTLLTNRVRSLDFGFTYNPSGSSNTVVSQTVEFNPNQDIYMEGSTFYNNTNLRIQQSSPTRRAFLKFTVSGVPAGAAVTSASLRLSESIDTGSGTIRFYNSTNTSWTESTISSSIPTSRSEFASYAGYVGNGQTISVDASSVITGNGSYTFIVTMEPNTNDVAFGSRESSNPPVLSVTYGSDGGTVDPTDPITPTPGSLLAHGLTTDPTAQDLDENGLPDFWEAIYNAKDLDPNADSDGDGTSNLTESGFGTDPFDPDSNPSIEIRRGSGNTIILSWARLQDRPGSPQKSTELGISSTEIAGTPVANGDRWELTIPITQDAEFFHINSTENDQDNDGVPDWIEPYIGFSNAPGDSQSVSRDKSYDTDGDNVVDTTLSGDLAAFNEIYRRSADDENLTRAQAARLLLQGTFGPATMDEVDTVASMGVDAWLDAQMALPKTLTRTYVNAIKADFDNGQTNSSLSGYYINGGGGGNPYVGGPNYTTAWIRVMLQAEDQLRQRVAFALSQILVASRSGAGLPNQVRATAYYYDIMIDNAFGNYEDLLMDVSLSPYMGNFLSHLGNRKADPSQLRFPDENYAREIMQLFTIGLWELNPDGTRKLDSNGDPIPTYGNYEITELAKVFTGVWYGSVANNNINFGYGWRDDGDSNHQFMVTPMKMYASEHDFGSKLVVAGNGNYHTIPARSYSNANALRSVEDAVYHLVRHPNTAPFICRQLIQFLVTSNPSPEYVERVASIFVNNGSGVTGDLNAVVRAIYTDDEARDPMEHVKTAHFGLLRDTLTRYMHLGRMLKLDRHQNLLAWDWGTHQEQTLMEPMFSPTVFNFYRPDFSLFGTLAENSLDSPAFEIVNSYSSISFPNWLWRMCNVGFSHPNGSGSGRYGEQSEDLSDLTALAGNIPALLDHLSILYTGGTLSADSRDAITTALSYESNMTERARLAAYLVLVSPEGSCLK
ncbi:MAG: DUF1800 family protein [Coraliomargaritaceae bacterium]